MSAPSPHRYGDAVEASDDGSVRHLRLTRGEQNNTLGPKLVAALRNALGESGSSGAVLLTAEGRHFCVGGDHAELTALAADAFRGYLAELVGLFSDLAGSPVPVVAAVHRGVVGGGLELALLADVLIAADDAWFELPQVRLRGRVGQYSYRQLISRCGLSVTRRLVLLGERLDAAAALRHGLVDQVVERSRLEEEGLLVAARLADQPRSAMSRARDELSELLGAAELLRAEAEQRAERARRT